MANKETYQIVPTDDLTHLVEQLNIILLEISSRLAYIDIPQTGIDSASTLAELITALISAGIVED